jgi:multidrug efflux pump subunit AcrB
LPANRIDAESQDLPAGLIGEDDGAREIRSQNQRRTPQDFADLAIVSEDDKRIHLGDIAKIERRHLPGSPTISLRGKNAVVLVLRRNETGDSLEAAEILQYWLDQTRPQLPPNIEIQVFNERWQLIKERIMLLLKNGAGGLVLVLLILYLFLSTRVAFWVAVGIPVSFMATLAVLYLVGGSINMISLFALIMALGIIVAGSGFIPDNHRGISAVDDDRRSHGQHHDGNSDRYRVRHRRFTDRKFPDPARPFTACLCAGTRGETISSKAKAQSGFCAFARSLVSAAGT